MEETFCEQTDRHTDRLSSTQLSKLQRTFETGFTRSTLSKSRPKNVSQECNFQLSQPFLLAEEQLAFPDTDTNPLMRHNMLHLTNPGQTIL